MTCFEGLSDSFVPCEENIIVKLNSSRHLLFATSDLLNGSSSINSAEIDWDFPIESLGHGDTCHNNDVYNVLVPK